MTRSLAMKFKFKKYGTNIYRPVISIRLENKNQSYKHEVLIDSGSDLCLFNADMAELLEVDLAESEQKYLGTVAGSSPFYMHDVTIRLGDASRKIKAGFIHGMPNSYGIVGIQGFFDQFAISFDLEKDEIVLEQKNNY